MGFGGISIWQLLIILAIVIMIFGTKRLKNIGSDLGGALKGFKQSLNEEEPEKETDETTSIQAQTSATDTDTDSTKNAETVESKKD